MVSLVHTDIFSFLQPVTVLNCVDENLHFHRNVDLRQLKHEAEFFGIQPLGELVSPPGLKWETSSESSSLVVTVVKSRKHCVSMCISG